MEIIITALLSYVLGAVPTAFLLVKFHHGVDIRENGTGNVGAMNSLKVSKSKSTGIKVLLGDFLKGLIAILLSKLIFGDNFIIQSTAILFSVIGHCFSFWIKFKGGKGLATAAGGSIGFLPSILIVWLLFWAISFVFKKNINFGNIVATFLTPLAFIVFADFFVKYGYPKAANSSQLIISVVLLMTVILIKHKPNIMELFIRNKNLDRET